MSGRNRETSLFVLVAAVSVGCLATPPPTWHGDVAPLMAAHCVSCHSDTGMAGFSLATFDEARPRATLIAASTRARRMPPWLPEPTLPFLHTRRLAEAEIATIAAWAAAGAPEGDPANAAPPVVRELPSIRVSAEVAMQAPYRPNPAVTDDYRCFVLDPQLATATSVTGFDIRPGNGKLVHHVILYAVAPDRLGKLQQLEDGTPGEGYTCYGGVGIPDAQMVGGWVPGTTATVFPTGTGVTLEAGSRLVMQVHYNTLTVQDAEDRTTALLEYTASDNVRDAHILPILQHEFTVLPGEVKTVRIDYDSSGFGVPDELAADVWGVLPHMHVHGRSIRLELTKADGTVLELVKIPRWDFQWQQFYFFEEPVEIRKGDRVALECVFDNRAENQPVVNGRQLEPTTLHWGEDTLAEMCLSFVYATLR
jgi:cytochrome c553